MANKHYGNFGDIWKHLALAEILQLEKPRQYWESHSGSASYEFTRSAERDHGALHFFSHGDQSGAIKSSQFYTRFKKIFENTGKPGIYPGSPLIALEILSDDVDRFVFCDLDGDSIASIDRAARDLKVPKLKMTVKTGDGLMTIENEAAEIKAGISSDIFILIDPYCIFDENEDGLNSLEVFLKLISSGMKVVLWYSFSSLCHYKALRNIFGFSTSLFEPKIASKKLWCGEIMIKASWQNGKINPALGILGCGILCANLDDKTVSMCKKVGQELAEVYRNSLIANGDSGELLFNNYTL